MAAKHSFEHPDDALRALAHRLSPVGIERGVSQCCGRVLAEDLTADRDSPAADVSAMDGYAIRLADLQQSEPIPIRGESAPGGPAPAMPSGAAMRIFTGAMVPPGCEAIVKREDAEELDGAIRWRASAANTRRGDHIRAAGENARAGSRVLSAGTVITAAQRATMANFGYETAPIYAPVRVAILTTGNEVDTFRGEPPRPWQLRNSNRAALLGLLESRPWIAIHDVQHCLDQRPALARLLAQRLRSADAVLLTGGVSMGDYDHVPDVVGEVGGEIIFHGLPIRPGKPILGAATGDGKLILGLPGNPVSATVGCLRMAMPLLARLSGQSQWLVPCPTVRLQGAGSQTIPLHWWRLVRLIDAGVAEPVHSQGSGDLVSLGQSTGIVELPPTSSGEGPWPYRPWT